MGEGLTRLLTIHDHLPQFLHAPILRGGAALVSLATRFSRRTEIGAEPPSVDHDLFVE